MCSVYVPNLSEIGQSAAELLMIIDRFFVRFRVYSNHSVGVLQTRGPICTKFGENIVRSSLNTKFNKKISYHKETVRLLHSIEIRVLH